MRDDSGEWALGYFGAINLLGARHPDWTPLGKFWSETFTFVELEYSFVLSSTGEAYTVSTTYVTFYDFDEGVSRVGGTAESMQFGPQTSAFEVIRHPDSQVAA